MNDTNDNNDVKTGAARTGGGTLTLKRPAGTEQSKVKQSFSHGRTKTLALGFNNNRLGTPM